MATDKQIDFVTSEDAQSQLRASGSRAMAAALILGIDHCEQEGHPLTQTQQISLTTMALMSYDTIIQGCELLEVQLPGQSLRAVRDQPQG